jgi:protein-S-isoprenylcysteine O-methyltransferase Ste14
MAFLENRIPPPVVGLVSAVVMVAIARVAPALNINSNITTILALVALIAALAFFIPAIRAFRRERTTINPISIDKASTLVTTGVFGVTRNPMYVALTLVLVALSIWLATPWTLLGPIAFVVFIQRFQIIPEERVLLAKFGAAYEDYTHRVRRWL